MTRSTSERIITSNDLSPDYLREKVRRSVYLLDDLDRELARGTSRLEVSMILDQLRGHAEVIQRECLLLSRYLPE